MKNITIDARMINASGIGTVIKNILRRIVVIKPEWHFYILGNINELKSFEYLHKPNIECIECNAPIYSIREQFELLKKIPGNTNIVWSPHYNIPFLYKGKIVVTIHDVFHLAMPQFVGGLHKKLYVKFMFNMVKYKSDKIITVSKFTANELKKYVGVDEKKITVIYNGIDEEWFNVKKDNPIHDKPYILYVGNVKPHKNLKVLVKAFLNVKNKINHDLIIVGKKDGFITEDKDIKNFVEKNENRIIFTGYVNDTLLKQYYKQADIFVFPSLYEGFGLPPLEALAAGCKRVICSNAASLPEICGDWVEYFDPDNIYELENLLIKESSIKLNNFMYSILQRYNWENIIDEMICILEDKI